MTRVALASCALLCACSAAVPPEPARSTTASPAAAPAAGISASAAPTPVASASAAEPSTTASSARQPRPQAAWPGRSASAEVAPPVSQAPPAASASAEVGTEGGLARGTGDAADRELTLGDAAYDAENYKQARLHYRKAERLSPKDPAAKLGLVRVSVSEADLPLDFAAAPTDPRIPPLLKQLDAALKLDPKYGPAHLERGHLLLIQGKAQLAMSSLESAALSMPRHAEAQSAVGVALTALGRPLSAQSSRRAPPRRPTAGVPGALAGQSDASGILSASRRGARSGAAILAGKFRDDHAIEADDCRERCAFCRASLPAWSRIRAGPWGGW